MQDLYNYTIKAILYTYSNGQLSSGEAIIYSPTTQDSRPVSSATGSFELNEGGTISFTLVYGHPLYNQLEPLETYVKVLDEGEEIFYGRIISKSDPTFTGQITYEAEGALNFLKDSEVSPESRMENKKTYGFTCITAHTSGSSFESAKWSINATVDNNSPEWQKNTAYAAGAVIKYTIKGTSTLSKRNLTARQFFEWCIAQHNTSVGNDPRRSFTVGDVTASKKSEKKDYQISSYTETKSVLSQYITGVYGGYFRVRPGANNIHYIDWIEEYPNLNSQTIQFINQNGTIYNENIISLTNATSADGVYTVIRPIGKSGITLDTPTIDLFSAAYMAKYGRIIKTVNFSNADTKAKLTEQVNAYIAQLNMAIVRETSLQLIDMHYLDGTTPKIRLGDRFNNIQGASGTEFTVGSVNLNFLHPESDSFSFKNKQELSKASNYGYGGGSISRASHRNSYSGGQNFQYYTESLGEAMIKTDNIKLYADQLLEFHANKIQQTANAHESLARVVEIHSGNITTIFGSELWQNADTITGLVGNFETKEGYYGDWPEWEPERFYGPGAKVKHTDSSGNTPVITGWRHVATGNRKSGKRFDAAEKNYWAQDTTRKVMQLLDGTQFLLNDDVGAMLNSGTLVNGAWSAVQEFYGSNLWVNREHIDAVSGLYQIVDGKKLRLVDGAQFQINMDGTWTEVGDAFEIIKEDKNFIESFQGTALWQKRNELGMLGGDILVTTKYYSDLPAWTPKTTYELGAMVRYTIDGVVKGFKLTKSDGGDHPSGNHMSYPSWPEDSSFWTEMPDRKSYTLLNGSSLVIDGVNGVQMSAGRLLSDLDADNKEFRGSNLWVNRDHIDAISGDWEEVEKYYDDLPAWAPSTNYNKGSMVKVVSTVDGENVTTGYKSKSARKSRPQFDASEIGHWDEMPNRKSIRLKNGAALQVSSVNGVNMTVGEVIDGTDEILGSALWTQREGITGVAGNFKIVEQYYQDLPEWQADHYYLKNSKVRIGSGSNAVGYQAHAGFRSGSTFESDLSNDRWDQLENRKVLQLKDGASMQLDDLNGHMVTVGSMADDLSTIQGSALWTQRDNITGVVGKFHEEVDKYDDLPEWKRYTWYAAGQKVKRTSNGTAEGYKAIDSHRSMSSFDSSHWESISGRKRLVIDSGGGMVITEDNQAFGLWHEGNLTGGMMVELLNDGTVTTRIRGDRIMVGGIDEDSDSYQNMIQKFGSVDGLIAEKATFNELQTVFAKISDVEADYLKTNNLRSEISLLESVYAKKLNSTKVVAADLLLTTHTVIPGQAEYDQETSVKSFIKEVQVVANPNDANSYILQFKRYSDSEWQNGGNFSRAASGGTIILNVGWSGASTGIFTVTANDANSTKKSIGFTGTASETHTKLGISQNGSIEFVTNQQGVINEKSVNVPIKVTETPAQSGAPITRYETYIASVNVTEVWNKGEAYGETYGRENVQFSGTWTRSNPSSTQNPIDKYEVKVNNAVKANNSPTIVLGELAYDGINHIYTATVTSSNPTGLSLYAESSTDAYDDGVIAGKGIVVPSLDWNLSNATVTAKNPNDSSKKTTENIYSSVVTGTSGNQALVKVLYGDPSDNSKELSGIRKTLRLTESKTNKRVDLELAVTNDGTTSWLQKASVSTAATYNAGWDYAIDEKHSRTTGAATDQEVTIKTLDYDERFSIRDVYTKSDGTTVPVTFTVAGKPDRWTAGFNAGVPTGATLGTKVTDALWNVNIARGSYAAVGKTIDLTNAYNDARVGYYSTAQYNSYGTSQYNAGWDYGLTEKISRKDRAATSQETTVKTLGYGDRWTIEDTKTKSNGSTIVVKYTVEAPANNWQTGFNAGVPTGATLGTKVTDALWNVNIARGSYAAVGKTIDLTNAYNDARVGYYSTAQYNSYGTSQRNAGHTDVTGNTSMSIGDWQSDGSGAIVSAAYGGVVFKSTKVAVPGVNSCTVSPSAVGVTRTTGGVTYENNSDGYYLNGKGSSAVAYIVTDVGITYGNNAKTLVRGLKAAPTALYKKGYSDGDSDGYTSGYSRGTTDGISTGLGRANARFASDSNGYSIEAFDKLNTSVVSHRMYYQLGVSGTTVQVEYKGGGKIGNTPTYSFPDPDAITIPKANRGFWDNTQTGTPPWGSATPTDIGDWGKTVYVNGSANGWLYFKTRVASDSHVKWYRIAATNGDSLYNSGVTAGKKQAGAAMDFGTEDTTHGVYEHFMKVTAKNSTSGATGSSTSYYLFLVKNGKKAQLWRSTDANYSSSADKKLMEISIS